jgi:hypothetical protein
MAINFPASPTTNQTYTFNGRTWTWNGVGWQATGSTGLTVYTKTDFTATAGQTSFSATYTVGFVDVFYNGSKLSTSEYTATTGSTVVLGTACAVGDIVETIAWTISSSFNPSLGSASATSLAIGGATIGSNALAVTGTTALSGLLTAAGGISSTLVTDATSATTGSIITAGGISTQKALWVGTTSQHVGAATFNGRITQSLSPVTAEYALRSTGQTTGWIAIDMANTGGDYIIAGENSTGNNLITGDSAYDMVIRGPSGISFSANAGATQQLRLTSAGTFRVQTGIGLFNGPSSGTSYSAQFLNYTAVDIFFEQSNGSASGVSGTIRVSQNATNSRSINATGTINASGADYAEYMVKADGCGVIAKGDIVGVNASGNLTDKFSDAHSFVIKSTDPSYVGGDSWSDGNPAVGPRPEPTSTEDEAEKAVLEAELVKWKERHEAARATVDRIAFSGQVPVNVTGATVGDYIIPVADATGGITGKPVTDPTFDQYRSAVGRVWKILEDGRAFVSVKVS